MAWLSLVIVAIVFFAPGIGVGQQLATPDIPLLLHVPLISVAFRIPFTGPLRLLAYSGGTWLILWQAPRLIEKAINEDFLTRFHILRNDLVNAFRPVISYQLAVRLAQIAIWFLVIKAFLLVLLQLIIERLIPFLATVLSIDVVSIISDFVLQSVSFLLSLTIRNIDILLIFAVLVLVANKGHELEQRERYLWDIRRNQIARRNAQIDIVVPATQK